MDGLPSSAFVAKLYTGAKVVKGFNHLGASALAADPVVVGGALVHARSPVWGPLIFQNIVKKEQWRICGQLREGVFPIPFPPAPPGLWSAISGHWIARGGLRAGSGLRAVSIVMGFGNDGVGIPAR